MNVVYDLSWRDDTPGFYECNEPRLVAPHRRRPYVPRPRSIRLPCPVPVDLKRFPVPSRQTTIQKRLLGALLWRNSRR